MTWYFRNLRRVYLNCYIRSYSYAGSGIGPNFSCSRHGTDPVWGELGLSLPGSHEQPISQWVGIRRTPVTNQRLGKRQEYLRIKPTILIWDRLVSKSGHNTNFRESAVPDSQSKGSIVFRRPMPMAVTDRSTWYWICLNISYVLHVPIRVRTISAVTSCVRNVPVMRVYSIFFDSFLIRIITKIWNIKWLSEHIAGNIFWARHFSAQIWLGAWGSGEWGAHCSVQAKWGNYAFESVHFMFHYPPPSQQQYPPAFLHLVTRKCFGPHRVFFSS